VIAAYLDELRIALAGARRERMAGRAAIERRLAALEVENGRLVDAIGKGAPAEAFVGRLQEIGAERSQLRFESEEQAPPIDAAIVHPGMVEHYRRSIAALHDMKDGTAETRQAGRALLSRLITRIEISPRADGGRGADMQLHGDLAALLSINDKSPTSKDAGVSDCDCMLPFLVDG
jgi:hypothetical protein